MLGRRVRLEADDEQGGSEQQRGEDRVGDVHASVLDQDAPDRRADQLPAPWIDPARAFAPMSSSGEWESWGNSADCAGRVSVMLAVTTASSA